MTKLIYLHIPKSGGTSQRTLLFDLYGRKNVFWHGSEQQHLVPDASIYDESYFNNFNVIGGHQPINYYPESLDAIYISVVREPISRVISLFSYFTKPHFADDYHKSAREEAFLNWQILGIDPNSLVNSLNNCSRFREEVFNYQCRYLSRYESTLEGVIRSFNGADIVIGESGSTTKTNTYLSDLLGWGNVPYRKLNSSKQKTHAIILQEPGLVEAVSEVVQEDLRLYNFIKEEQGGLFSNFSPRASVTQRLRPSNPFAKKSQHVFPWKQVQVFTKGYIGIQEDGTGSTAIIIMNNSPVTLSKKLFPELELYYTLHGRTGQVLGEGCSISAPQIEIPANSNMARELKVVIPKEHLPEVVCIQIGLLVKSSERVAENNPLHLASAHIVPV